MCQNFKGLPFLLDLQYEHFYEVFFCIVFSRFMLICNFPLMCLLLKFTQQLLFVRISTFVNKFTNFSFVVSLCVCPCLSLFIHQTCMKFHKIIKVQLLKNDSKFCHKFSSFRVVHACMTVCMCVCVFIFSPILFSMYNIENRFRLVYLKKHQQ